MDGVSGYPEKHGLKPWHLSVARKLKCFSVSAIFSSMQRETKTTTLTASE